MRVGCLFKESRLSMDTTVNRRMLQAQLAKIEWYVEVSERVVERRQRELVKCNTPLARQLLALSKEKKRWHVAHRDWLRKQLQETAGSTSAVADRGSHRPIY